jgi:hypothetical protein
MTPRTDAVPTEEFRIKRLREWAHNAMLRQPGGSIIERTVAEDMQHLEAKYQRDLAAALEENAKLRKHAEAMASTRESKAAYCPEEFTDLFDIAYDAYRADFPKEEPR